MQTKIQKWLYADEGKRITDGENYWKMVRIAEDADESSFYEVTEEEYESIIAVDENMATEADAQIIHGETYL